MLFLACFLRAQLKKSSFENGGNERAGSRRVMHGLSAIASTLAAPSELIYLWHCAMIGTLRWLRLARRRPCATRAAMSRSPRRSRSRPRSASATTWTRWWVLQWVMLRGSALRR